MHLEKEINGEFSSHAGFTNAQVWTVFLTNYHLPLILELGESL